MNKKNTNEKIEEKNNFSNLNLNYEKEVFNKSLRIIKKNSFNELNVDDSINLDNFNLNDYNLENLIDDIRLTTSTGIKEENIESYNKYIPRHKYLKPIKSILNKNKNKNKKKIKFDDNLEILKVKSYKLLNSDMAKMVKIINKEKEEEENKFCIIF